MNDATQIGNREEGIAKIAELVKDIRFAMLTSVTSEGALHSRPMATQHTPFTGELLFLTREQSGKVQEIEHDSQVSLTYVDAKHTFLTISGHARIENDRSLIGELWNPMYKAWFTEGKEDPEIRVLRVTVEQAEYWDAPSNGLLRGAQVLARAVTGGKTHVGEHATVQF